MGRKNVSDGLVNQLRLVNGYEEGSAGSVVAHSHMVLNMGVDRAAIVLNSRFEQRPLTIGRMTQVDWYFEVECWFRHNNDIEQARADSDTYVQNIMDRIQGNDTLGGSCFNAEVVSGQVEDEKLVIGGKPFLLESLTIKCQENLA